MSYYPIFLVDTGILVAFFNRSDRYHAQVYPFMMNSTSIVLTTIACITEALHLLPSNPAIQNDLLLMVAQEIIAIEHLQPNDFTRIVELNLQYADLKPDFADLALVTISERLDIPAIATLDADFDIYIRYRKQPFDRVFCPS
ncbi:VapC toxin family PIN domain ribonuclease [Chroococcidiopsis sp. CCALA 051]|uniref:type II toxin-antitoxin system VapC family toxin n=1 Tax=Chroococcidiopsis sp. CCALA 051 TaxID=869949 RepID=UPI000D0DDBE3|nr:PIN domain-containing protein [Chroococcidiopsis sp. CCALA 051]PSM49167.1 VapC toxin family PIN domain ribonuclease [Chroococcidiopsis sp. CCALA 051]